MFRRTDPCLKLTTGGVKFSKNSAPYGYVAAIMSADPKFFDDFEVAANEIAAKLRKGGITQDELDRARKPILESMERGEKENGTWIGVAARAQTDPTGLEYRRSRKTMFEGMTPTKLDQYARELFDASGLHVVKILPETKE